jgi:hypothetical protein
MIQRASEGFKKGITKSEFSFALHLQRNHIDYISQDLFCLSCGTHAKSFGDICLKCDTELTTKGSLARPDFFIEPLKLIIQIDGSAHDRPKREELDNYQQQKLIALGYKIIRYRNEEVVKL